MKSRLSSTRIPSSLALGGFVVTTAGSVRAPSASGAVRGPSTTGTING